MTGLSPRLRGNLPGAGRWRSTRRSIPALTGKPRIPPGSEGELGVYPRAYGETSQQIDCLLVVKGLSPRLRGNHAFCSLESPRLRGNRQCRAAWAWWRRSIPALTGKPHPGRRDPRGRGVYPRAYGETASRAVSAVHTRGLSPRLRGNLGTAATTPAVSRSIPALTGKPKVAISGYQDDGVYPRAYGETSRSGGARERS